MATTKSTGAKSAKASPASKKPSPLIPVATGRKAALMAKTPKGHPAPHEIMRCPTSDIEQHCYVDGSKRFVRPGNVGHTKHTPKANPAKR